MAESPRSYLASITTRLAIDHLRSARVRRETYPGQWLPEPIVEQTPADQAETADSLSMAFLVLLEQLSPVERAVFLLREVFGYEFDEIARVVGRSEANCRQILVRARAHVSERRPRFESSPQKREELAQRFFAACRDGDQEALVGLLAADAAVYGDGGGKVHASPVPIVGRDRAARALIRRNAVTTVKEGAATHCGGPEFKAVALLLPECGASARNHLRADGVSLAIHPLLALNGWSRCFADSSEHSF